MSGLPEDGLAMPLEELLGYQDARTDKAEEDPVNLDYLDLPPHFSRGVARAALVSDGSQLPSSRLPLWFQLRFQQPRPWRRSSQTRSVDRNFPNNLRRPQRWSRRYADHSVLSLPSNEGVAAWDRDRETQADNSPARSMVVSSSSLSTLSSAPSSPLRFPIRPRSVDGFPWSRSHRFREAQREISARRIGVGESETETGTEGEGQDIDDGLNYSNGCLRPETYRRQDEAWDGVTEQGAEEEGHGRVSEQDQPNSQDSHNLDQELDQEWDRVDAPVPDAFCQRQARLDHEERRMLEDFDLAMRSGQGSRTWGFCASRRYREWRGDS